MTQDRTLASRLTCIVQVGEEIVRSTVTTLIPVYKLTQHALKETAL